ncbi:unnamed protein product [Protopolystoma xenopodis]|uniref:AMP-dependent synthetase/ligase domain-containing protein n=1 Tax=Protopolystoma xenopodis TaxID=117903 RepID=A0A448WPT9_9PLAT|nr:unnamed protein product [Protopolystoma xenopodis]
MSRFVHQVFVEGNSLQSYTVAIVVPDQESVSAALLVADSDANVLSFTNRQYDYSSSAQRPSREGDWPLKGELEVESEDDLTVDGLVPMSKICSDPRTEKLILQDMRRLGQENDLKGFEQVKVIRLIAEPFSIENGILTPTMKACRQIVRRRYAKEIEAMYMNQDPGRT